ncbi:MAG: hypothetical protein ACD_82C00190G0002 [uncultured bacterium]|nr:MAG: hypothetical protein ACD_82C00190G0002 [uncultured bacterium]
MQIIENNIFIAFDFGTKNIGVAVGQLITKSATVLKPLYAIKGVPDWKCVDKIILDWNPTALIVGVPYKFDGTEFPVTKLARNFIEQLIQHYHLPVHAAEERWTTKTAKEEIFARGGYKALQKESVDCMAARLILEEWMQTNF